jgi:hypothetical protein
MNEIRKVAGPLDVNPGELYYQYIPGLIDESVWHNDMSVPNSPHVELVELMLLMVQGPGFDWDVLKKTRYYQDRTYRMDRGIGSDEYIKTKMLARYRVLKSIREHGLDKKQSNKAPIIVLRKPFWQTRFNCQEPWLSGMEIWDGGGRCAIAHVLELKTVPVYVYEDAYPGTCRSDKFEKKMKGFLDGVHHNPKL